MTKSFPSNFLTVEGLFCKKKDTRFFQKRQQMKFYNYFSNQNELKFYLNGFFFGKGIYFDSGEFQKKETLRSSLKFFSKNEDLNFIFKIKNAKPVNFRTKISDIVNIQEDICKFSIGETLFQIQAMTKNKMHIHVSGYKNQIPVILISGILHRSRFHEIRKIFFF